MTIWFIQWTEKEVKELLGKRDFMMDCIGNGNKNFINRATPKDIVWIHAIVEGKHNALNDALAQAKAVQQSYKKLYGH